MLAPNTPGIIDFMAGDEKRKRTIFALHAAATASDLVLESVDYVTAGNPNTVMTALDFWLAHVPPDRRARPQFAMVAANIRAIATNPALRQVAPRGSRRGQNPTTSVSAIEATVHRELMRLGEDRCTPKSMQTMRLRYERDE